MHLQPQPPPDAPAPPPGPEAIRSRRKALWIFIPGFLLIGAFLSIGATSYSNKRSHATFTEVEGNALKLYWTLIKFESDYGQFPNATTEAKVKLKSGPALSLGTTTSNGLFRQLFATTPPSELLFYAPSSITPSKPNGRLQADTLIKGECAFAYIAGLSSSDDPKTPLLLAPVDSSLSKFERRSDYGNKAYILCVDGTSRLLPIDWHGNIQFNGMNLLDPRQPFWKGKAPDIKWPE